MAGLLPVVNSDAQSPEAFSFNSTIAPSVESYAIAQSGKLSPSLYTGAMIHSLPIYVYEDPDFTIPVSLDYSFSGYRPAVHSGTVGYGWTLNCGGVITREVIGLPDDANDADSGTAGYSLALENGIFDDGDHTLEISKQFYLQHYVGDVSSLSNVNLFSDRPEYNGIYDTCPDIFSFSFLGHSGDFMLTQDGSVKVFNSDIPSGQISVECTFDSPFPHETSFSEIRIKTGDGYCYSFGGSHNNLEFSKSSGSGNGTFTVSAWKLRKITAPNGKTAEFIYDDFQKDFSIFESYSPEIDTFAAGMDTLFGELATSQTLTYTSASIYSLLSEVRIGDDCPMKFLYSEKERTENDNDDFNHTKIEQSMGIYGYEVDELKLSSIRILNSQNQTVDQIDLNHIYTVDGSGSPRMFLSNVRSRHNGSHLFSYDINSHTSLPKNDTNGTDYWGYWNGKDSAYSLKSYILNPNEDSPLLNLYSQLNDLSVKAADFNYAKTGGLTEITYPTGGKTEIFYEPHNVDNIVTAPNTYVPNDISFVPGGVRVARIVNRSEEINDSTTYRYGGGILMQMPRYAVFLKYRYYTRMHDPFQEGVTADVHAHIHSIGYTDDCDSAAPRSNHVGYSNVAVEYLDGSYIQHEYYDVFDYIDSNAYSTDGGTVYSDVTIHDKQQYFSTIDYVYVDETSSNRSVIRNEFLPNTHDYSRVRGKLKSVKEYDMDEELVKSVEYVYESLMQPTHTQTMVYNTLLDFTEAPLNIYAPKLIMEVHTTSFENGETTETVSYAYNDLGQLEMTGRQCGDEQEWKWIKYYTESYPSYSGDILKSCVTAEVYLTEGTDGEEFILGGARYYYDDLTNPQPSKVEYYSSDTPVIRGNYAFSVPDGYITQTVTFAYDPDLKRLTREDYPGGIYHCYTWDAKGKNILSKKSNDDSAVTSYQWKDMVGVTGIIYPTGLADTYVYDNENRLSMIYDSEGNPKVGYRYNLVNP